MSLLSLTRSFGLILLGLSIGSLIACSSTVKKTDAGTAESSVQPSEAAAVVAPVIPERARSDFDRAVQAFQAKDWVNAELEFKQLTEAYPQYAAPYINLGIIYRNAGQLDEALKAFTTATEREVGNVIAWNELGVTYRMLGRFNEAAQSYQRALQLDDTVAVVHRNYGILLDLYLADAVTALTHFEKYKELSGEEKPVNGWIAELRQRIGKNSETPAEAP
jgi:tetratricopeptide (TPR) repeat protein